MCANQEHATIAQRPDGEGQSTTEINQCSSTPGKPLIRFSWTKSGTVSFFLLSSEPLRPRMSELLPEVVVPFSLMTCGGLGQQSGMKASLASFGRCKAKHSLWREFWDSSVTHHSAGGCKNIYNSVFIPNVNIPILLLSDVFIKRKNRDDVTVHFTTHNLYFCNIVIGDYY